MTSQIPYAANDDMPPLDLEFLQRQTQGNRVLRRELLAMFRDQLLEVQGTLAAETMRPQAALHALRGAALNLGAFALAEELRKVDEQPNPATARVDRAIVTVLRYLDMQLA